MADYIWGTTIRVNEMKALCSRFVGDSIAKHPERAKANPIDFDLREVEAFDKTLHHSVCEYPTQMLHFLDNAVNETRGEMDDPAETRVFGLDEVKRIRGLTSADIERLVCVRGMVTRVSFVIPSMKAGFFECTVCAYNETLPVDVRGTLTVPPKCPHCSKSGTFELKHTRSIFADKQLVRLQEAPEVIPAGETPQTTHLLTSGSSIDAVKPGDRVEVTGVYRAEPVKVGVAQRVVRSIFKSYIDVVHIRKYAKETKPAEDIRALMCPGTSTSFLWATRGRQRASC